MPRGRRSNLRRKPARKGRKGGKRNLVGRSAGPLIAEKQQAAHIVETIEFVDLSGNNAHLFTFNLGDFPRASALAPHFQWYKATKCTYTYEPLFNVFDEGAGQASKPYLLTVMNRTQNASFNQLADKSSFLAAGARPVTLVSTKKISYSPNWCAGGLIAQRTTTLGTGEKVVDTESVGLMARRDWLATPSAIPIVYSDGSAYDTSNPVIHTAKPVPTTTPFVMPAVLVNAVEYNGHISYLDQAIVGSAPSQPICRVTLQVVWKFKGAKNSLAKTPSPGPSELKVSEIPA